MTLGTKNGVRRSYRIWLRDWITYIVAGSEDSILVMDGVKTAPVKMVTQLLKLSSGESWVSLVEETDCDDK